MKRAVLYARHSTDKQNEASSTDQLALCRKFCSTNNIQIIREFSDEAHSGTSTLNRAGFLQLVEFLENRNCDLVICEDLSRLSRDIADLSTFYRRLKFLGIQLFSVNDGAIEDLAIGFKGTLSTVMLESIRKMTKRGQEASVLKGKIPGGVQYGYERIMVRNNKGRIETGFVKIKDTEAEVVRWIFEEYCKTRKLKPICDKLNEQGIPSPKGKKWSSSTLCGTKKRQTGILRNTLYKGVVTFNRMEYRKNPDTGRKIGFVRDKEQWITSSVPELRIVEKRLFKKVQTILNFKQPKTDQVTSSISKSERQKVRYQERSINGHTHKTENRESRFILFSGLTFCHQHKGKIIASKAGRYSCPHKNCPNKGIDYLAFTKEVLRQMQSLSLEQMHEYETSKLQEANDLKYKIHEYRNKIHPITEKLTDIYLNHWSLPTQTLIDLANKLEKEKEDLNWHLKNCESLLKTYQCLNDRKRSRTWQKFLKALNAALNDPENTKKIVLIKKCIRKATINKKKNQIYCVIEFNFENIYALYNV